MPTLKRMSARDAHLRVAWEEALLVCAYDSEAKFHEAHLYDAISLDEFKARLPKLAKDQEIIFY